MKRKYINGVLSVLTVCFLSSCLRKEENIAHPQPFSFTFDGLNAQLNFPDTILVGKQYEGHIEYRYSQFDKLHEIKDIEVIRLLQFYFTLDTIAYKMDSVERQVSDSVVSFNKNRIDLYDVTMSKPGVYYISGYIDDEIAIDSLENKKEKGVLYVYTFRSYLIKKIVAIEE